MKIISVNNRQYEILNFLELTPGKLYFPFFRFIHRKYEIPIFCVETKKKKYVFEVTPTFQEEMIVQRDEEELWSEPSLSRKSQEIFSALKEHGLFVFLRLTKEKSSLKMQLLLKSDMIFLHFHEPTKRTFGKDISEMHYPKKIDWEGFVEVNGDNVLDELVLDSKTLFDKNTLLEQELEQRKHAFKNKEIFKNGINRYKQKREKPKSESQVMLENLRKKYKI
jgi:hypothetical protein